MAGHVSLSNALEDKRYFVPAWNQALIPWPSILLFTKITLLFMICKL